MRRSTVLLMLLCLTATAAAQDVAVVVLEKVDMEQMKTVLTQSRRTVFDHGMGLDVASKDAFWDIYAQYEAEKQSLDEKRLAFLQDYAAKAEQLTDNQALDLARSAAGVAKKEVELRLKYTNKIGKAVGGKVGARFYQIDAYITNVLTLEVLDNMQLIGNGN
jgi:hypothetical protein